MNTYAAQPVAAWIVEDDVEFVTELSEFLQPYSIKLSHFPDAASLMAKLEGTERPDLIVVDQFVCGRDLLYVLPSIRQRFAGPLVVMTGNQQEADRVIGLELGADDFIVKTMPPREVLARFRALSRRAPLGATGPQEAPQAVPPRTAAWHLDPRSMDVLGPDGQRLGLTTHQYRVLELLNQTPGQLVPRDDIYRHLYGRSMPISTRSVDTLVSQIRRRIRQYLGEDTNVTVRSVRGTGYVFSGFEE